jgi:hypothetical protein
MSRRATALAVAGVLLVALIGKVAFDHLSPGHPGELVERALHVYVVPLHRLHSGVYDQPDGVHFGRPMIEIAASADNNSGDHLWIGQCLATAFDIQGHALFQTKTMGLYGRLVGPNIHSGPPVGRDGAWFSGPTIDTKENADITRADVRSVERYETHCDTYKWVGALPHPPGDSDD